MTQEFRIEGTLPGLNEYTRASRSGPYVGARMKKRAELEVMLFVRQAQLRPCRGMVRIAYLWVEPNRRRDLDNIAFAKKFVQDALVKAGVLAGDGPKHIKGFSDEFAYDKAAPGVVVRIEEVDDDKDV